MKTANLRVRIDDEADYAAAVKAVAATAGVEINVVTESGEVELSLEPITAVLVGAGVLAAGKFITDLIDRLRGGVVIDRRSDSIDTLYRDRSLPYGWVVIIPPDGGRVEIDVKDAAKDAQERLLSEVISGVLNTTPMVAAAAQDALGASGVKESHPPTAGPAH
jgi:hypothetical protein